MGRSTPSSCPPVAPRIRAGTVEPSSVLAGSTSASASRSRCQPRMVGCGPCPQPHASPAGPAYHLVRPAPLGRAGGAGRRPATRRRAPGRAAARARGAGAPARPRRWSRRSPSGSRPAARAPDQVLALTFSRKAAEQLRDRVTARLGRTTGSAMCSTIHSFAYGLVRRYAPRELYRAPLRLLSAPEQDVVVRELLQRHAESVRRGLPVSTAAVETRGFAREVQMVLSRAREKGMESDQLVVPGRAGGPSGAGRGRCCSWPTTSPTSTTSRPPTTPTSSGAP